MPGTPQLRVNSYQKALLAAKAQLNIPILNYLRVRIDGPAIRDRHFAGALDRHQSIQVFLDNLKAIARIDACFDKDSVLHFK